MLFLEALTFTRSPDKPKIVVEGVNSTNVDLIWEILPGNGESVQNLFLIRQRPRDVNLVTIATRTFSGSFDFENNSFANEYSTTLPATLTLLNVDNTEEYVYTLQVNYNLNSRPRRMEDKVTVIVRGKCNSFTLFLRRIFKSVTLIHTNYFSRLSTNFRWTLFPRPLNFLWRSLSFFLS